MDPYPCHAKQKTVHCQLCRILEGEDPLAAVFPYKGSRDAMFYFLNAANWMHKAVPLGLVSILDRAAAVPLISVGRLT